MAKSAQQLVEEARKKNAAQEAAKQEATKQDTSALDELLSGIAAEDQAPVEQVFEQPVPVVTEVPETAPVTGVTTIEDAVFVPPVQDYAADATLTLGVPDTIIASTTNSVSAVTHTHDFTTPVYDKATLAEIEAGRKALEKYK